MIDANVLNESVIDTSRPKPLPPVVGGIKVKAIAKGYYNGLREIGDVFVIGPIRGKAPGAKWYVPVEKQPAPATEKKAAVLTDSELA